MAVSIAKSFEFVALSVSFIFLVLLVDGVKTSKDGWMFMAKGHNEVLSNNKGKPFSRTLTESVIFIILSYLRKLQNLKGSSNTYKHTGETFIALVLTPTYVFTPQCTCYKMKFRSI